MSPTMTLEEVGGLYAMRWLLSARMLVFRKVDQVSPDKLANEKVSPEVAHRS